MNFPDNRIEPIEGTHRGINKEKPDHKKMKMLTAKHIACPLDDTVMKAQAVCVRMIMIYRSVGANARCQCVI